MELFLSLVLLVVILVEVVPKFASYSRLGCHVPSLHAGRRVATAAVALETQLTGAWPYQAAVPGLRFWDGFLEIETTGADRRKYRTLPGEPWPSA